MLVPWPSIQVRRQHSMPGLGATAAVAESSRALMELVAGLQSTLAYRLPSFWFSLSTPSRPRRSMQGPRTLGFSRASTVVGLGLLQTLVLHPRLLRPWRLIR